MPKHLANVQTSWDLSGFAVSDADPRLDQKLAAAKKANEEFVEKWYNRTDYLENALVLKQALDDFEALQANVGLSGDVGYYFSLRSALDQENPTLKAKENLLDEQERLLANKLEFFEHRLSKVPRAMQQLFLNFPDLAEYKHYLERLFVLSPFLLSEEAEKILTLKAKTSSANWVRMTSDLLSRESAMAVGVDGRKTRKNLSELVSLTTSPVKEVRDSAAAAFNKILVKHADVAEAELNSVLEDKKTNDALRNIVRPDIPRLLSDDISPEVVDTLLESVSKKFDVAHAYYEVKAKLLGVPKLKYHERNVDYGSLANNIPYVEALNIVGSTLEKLDPTFSAIFQDYIRQGRIDVYPKKGKSDGAFSAHGLKTQPGYILTNYTGKVTDVITLAHEVGHAINGELMKKQNSLNFDTPKSTAEVASTFFESYILEELRATATKEDKRAIAMYQLNEVVSTVYRQVACYKFEQELHATFRKTGYLSKKDIGELFTQHMAAYMGNFVEQSYGSENWWVYWGHIRSFFYVYSYASGFLIAQALKRFVEQDRTYVEKIKMFLGAGTSKSPKAIFSELDVDIAAPSFWENGLLESEHLLTEVLNY